MRSLRLIRLTRFTAPLLVLCYWGAVAHPAGLAAEPAAAQTVTLDEAFRAALIATERTKIAEAAALEGDERAWQARGALFPTLSGSAGATLQQAGGAGAFGQPQQTQAKISALMPVTHGLREFAGFRAVDSQKRSLQWQVRQARATTYLDVSLAFHGLWVAHRDLENLVTQKDLLNQRVKVLAGRAGVGRIRRSDLLSAQSQAALLAAQVSAATTTLAQQREAFASATGLPRDRYPKIDPHAPRQERASLDRALAAIERRPDVLSRKELAEAADASVRMAWGGHLPSLDLGANYYLKRAGILENVKWDASATLTLPLFQGLVAKSQVDEASARRTQAELQLVLARREAEREIRASHAAVEGAITQIKDLEAALAAAERSYEALKRDDAAGLATQIEVLQAMSFVYDTRRALDRAHADARVAESRYLVASGEVPDGAL